jgi:DNA-binding response OmpR family regulator
VTTEKSERLRVLVVDDERSIADTLAAILDMNGFAAVPIYSGDVAVENARESGLDVLICDIILDGANGIEVAMRIREFCPTCKIILISGAQASIDLLDEAEARGHEFEVWAKPFHPTTLIDRLRALNTSDA